MADFVLDTGEIGKLTEEIKKAEREKRLRRPSETSVYIPSVVFAIGARSEPVNIRFGI